MTKMLGGERVVQMLEAEGVDTVFGIIDGSYFGLYSRLRDHGIRLITPRHETTAVHMAGAYARLTGRLGVCIASNGPGVANALPGVAVENGEGNRVLLVTSWRRSPIVSPDRGGTYQYFDQVAVTRPMTKWSGAATSYERVPEMLRRALRIAWQGRPGVVHVCIPEDVLNGEFDAPGAPDPAPARYRRQAPIAPDPITVRHAADLLVGAELPMIHAGSGVLHAAASAELRELAELLRRASDHELGRARRDRRAFPRLRPDALRRAHQPRAQRRRRRARVGNPLRRDRLVGQAAVLARRRRATGGPGRRRRADARPQQADRPRDRCRRSRVPHRAPRRAGRARLLGSSRPTRGQAARVRSGARTKLAAALDAARAEGGAPIHSAHVAPICQEVFDDDSVLVIDGGNTAIWANLYHEARVPHTLLSTWKFGMLGACLGQALGAQAAFPDRQVYCITGDGAMGFHPQEIETAVRNQLPVVFLVLCDRAWGMVKVNQEFAIDADRLLTDGELPDEAHINTDLGEIRWDLLAQSMGAHGERVASPDELRPALERCLAAGRCAVVHVDVDPKAHKFAPNLLTFKEMHAEPAG